MLKLIQDLNLTIVNNEENSSYTFRHKSLDNVTSCLDYFITTEDISADLEVLHDIAENTSAHSPVRTKLQVSVPKPNSQNQEQATMVAKRTVKWKQGNPKGYSNMLESTLEGYNFATADPEDAISKLTFLITEAERQNFPSSLKKASNKASKDFYPELASAIKKSKAAHYEWKMLGRPPNDHPASIQRRKASSEVRKTQRIKEATRRHQLYNDILEAHEKDSSTFYRLLRKKHGQRASQVALRIDGAINYDLTCQREAWAEYYRNLATPVSQEQSSLIRILDKITSSGHSTLITPKHTEQAIRRLNTGKAADLHGIQST